MDPNTVEIPDEKSGTTVKFLYTLRLSAGFAFILFAVWLTYWLLFQYQVRNLVGITAIIVFLASPSIISVLKIPAEVLALVAIWRSDDPEPVNPDETLGGNN